MRASSLCERPRSLSTRAVMPTLVAVSVAPRNACTYDECSGSSHAPTPQPSANGATTPTLATTNDDRPTFSICATVDSRPTSNSRMITPRRASMSIEASVLIGSSACDADQRQVAEQHADHELAEHRRLAERASRDRRRASPRAGSPRGTAPPTATGSACCDPSDAAAGTARSASASPDTSIEIRRFIGFGWANNTPFASARSRFWSLRPDADLQAAAQGQQRGEAAIAELHCRELDRGDARRRQDPFVAGQRGACQSCHDLGQRSEVDAQRSLQGRQERGVVDPG